MSTNEENDWGELRELWREESETDLQTLHELPRRVRRQTLRMFVWSVLEGVLTLGLAWVVLRVALRNPDPPTLAWAVAIGIFFIVALTFTFYNRKGIWRASAETTRAFLDLRAERARRKLQTVRFSRWLLAAEVVFLIPWTIWDASVSSQTPARYALMGGLTAVLVIAALGWSIWYRKCALEELERLEQLRRGLELSPHAAVVTKQPRRTP